MKWEEFISKNHTDKIKNDGQIKTDIKCPECGRYIYYDSRIALTSYPLQYVYWCSCGWKKYAPYKWSNK